MKHSEYMEKTYLYGKIATIIALGIMLIIPTIMCTFYNMWPDGSAIIAVAGPLLALYVPTALAEQLSMIPMGGNTCYINSIMGNVTNIKFPCYLSAINSVDATPGSEMADVIGMIAVCISGMVTMIVVFLGLVLLVPLEPILTSEVVTTATSYIMPALYGSMGISAFINTSAGSYSVPKKPLVAILDLILVFAFNFLVMNLAGKEGYAMLVMLGVSILIAYILYKSNIIKLIKKESI
ncbi:MAG: hypothetical protein SOR77_07750 [Peptoniphilus sp.]|uniref:hypothetical protein n=1 Tax=Peptoniphilus sp. TaxID=1971214 RepID=UPI002A749761|nr:hypothetical protein [Peptoniphilus sp.]MDY2987511.1 hypothetical protein [Peptoniphilus sp.]